MAFLVGDLHNEPVVLWSVSAAGFSPGVHVISRLSFGTTVLAIGLSPDRTGSGYVYVLVSGMLGFVRSELVRKARVR